MYKKTFLLAIGVLLVAGAPAMAAFNTFTGPSPYEYTTTTNWNQGRLPNSADTGFILNGLYNTVQLSTPLSMTDSALTPSSLMVGAMYLDYATETHLGGSGSLRLSGNASLKVVGALNVGYENERDATSGEVSGELTIDGGTLMAGSGNIGYCAATPLHGSATATVTINAGLLAITGSVANKGLTTYTLNGGSLSIGGALNLAQNSIGSLTLNGGNATLGGLSLASSGGETTVGTVEVKTGTSLTLTGTSSLIGYGAFGNANGTLTVSGGAVNVTNAAAKVIFGLKTASNTGNLVVTSGSYTQTGGANSYLVFGGSSNGGVGNLNQSGGVVTVNNLYFGDYGVGNGTISGTAALNVTTMLNVGDRGVGNVTQSAGNVTAAVLAVAPAHTGGNGSSYTISGGSLALGVTGGTTTALSLGGIAATNATLYVQGGNVSIAQGNTIATAATGSLNVSGGTINANGASIGTLGSFAFTGGTLNNVAAVGTDVSVAGGTATLNQDTGFNATVTGAITGAGAVTKTGAGNLTLNDGANTYTGKTTAGGGALTFASTGSFNVLNAGAGNTLDLQHGTVVFDYTGGTDPVATIRANLRASYLAGTAGHTLDAGSFYTSTGSAGGYGISYLDDGLATVTTKIAIYGDTDASGAVNGNDVSRVLANLGKTSGANWYQGDFNYDGAVNGNDVSILLANLGKTFAGMSSPLAFNTSTVPEPSTLALLAAGLVGLLAYAWRKRK